MLPWMVGVGLVIVFGALNAFGIEAFGKAEIVLTFAMWSTLVIFGITGLLSPHAVPLEGWFGSTLSLSDPFAVFSLIGMAMFMSSVVSWSRRWRRRSNAPPA
jgi:amino acid transporter